MATPKVFVSYSHDSPEHKMWVMKLAEKLFKHGVEVLLDAWELKPGVDISMFMERSLKEADRILMVCTPNYVKKAEEGKGGVGYEKTIMTAEYMRSVQSTRVIPIIREKGTTHVPAFLSTKMYLDFSTDEVAEFNFDELVRELHGKPLYVKPELGAVPNFDTKPAAEPKLAEDPVLKAMKALINAYEASNKDAIWKPQVVDAARQLGMSRTYFDTIFAQLEELGYVHVSSGFAYLTDAGRAYALENKLA